ncbi:hypothetical protein B0T21DRAFT_288626 [Apiosordaria backusii]|uniref:Zn(2)-C6 fungal-type domain-containing protein n=1 Tax=Apiosordaria backusii TaxID=314023 RepID=A0AA40EEB5_9PEZI|nr:hypothetical protein B0T21DRAFT_288626 [Apiosordaria backusii]
MEQPRSTPTPQASAARRITKRLPLNKFACQRCQQKKTKCDGGRPLCGACARRHELTCEYPVREGAVSRYSDLKQTSEKLERENKGLRELFAYLRERPDNEAFEIFQRLRQAKDPLVTLQHIRDADTLLMVPSISCMATFDKERIDIENNALAGSPLRVPSQPWTSIAGDGLVSHLISSLFQWDHPFIIPFIDREVFLRDMRKGEGPYCSAFLVNAICAFRSLMSDKARQIRQVTNTDLSAEFLLEAKRRWEVDAKKGSIPTVQGLYLLFLISCCDGTNIAGSMYRFAAFNMLQRLNPDKVVPKLKEDIAEEAEKKAALSKLHWGIFLVESTISFAFLKPSLLAAPRYPWAERASYPDDPNTDVTGTPYGPGSPEPPIVPGLGPAGYELALLAHMVMVYNMHPRGPLGQRLDIQERRLHFASLAAVERSFFPRFSYQQNPTPQTLFLKSFINMIAYSIVRPLHPSAEIQPNYPVKTILLELCAVDIHIVETYTRLWALKEYSPMFLASLWSVTLTLLSHFDDPRAAGLFTRACVLLKVVQKDLAAVSIVMQGILAMAWKTKQRIPEEARPYFAGLEEKRKELGEGVPFEFALPLPPGGKEVGWEGADGDDDADDDDDGLEEGVLGADVAVLLQKWSALAVD